MSAAAQNLGLLNQFKDTHEEAPSAHKPTFRLTPHLVLAAALLHMMASDGEIEEAESSQLQAVLGGDQQVMNVAVQYVQATPLTQFLTDACQVLDRASTLCVLTNVCDSLLADGSAGPDEVALFERMKTAWGIDTASFAPYEKAIALKNNATVMGEYQPDHLSTPGGSAHLALAASLLYMMAADGTIATEEIGQLQTVIGEFKGLQEAALKQVRSVKLPDFLKITAPHLSAEVKLYILTNVCDSMMADGDVDALENKIFHTMMAGFGHDSASFKPYYQSIKVKNIKTFSASVHKPKLIYSNVASGNEVGEEGARFNRDNSSQKDESHAGGKPATSAAKGAVISHVLPGQDGVHVGNRTMQDNINKVTQGFGDEDRIHQVQENALSDQAIPMPKAAVVDDNIQSIESKPMAPATAGPVLQAVANTGAGPVLCSPHSAQAHQPLPATFQASANVMRLPSQALTSNVAGLPNQGLADRNLPLAPASEPTNTVKLGATGLLGNAIPLTPCANEAHLEQLPATDAGKNIQPLPDTALTSNRQAVSQEPTGTHRDNAPIQTIGTHRAKLPHSAATPSSTVIEKRVAPSPELTLMAARAVVQKANRVKQLSAHVSQLRLRLDQLAGLNHEVLAAAQQAAGGPCINCGNPQCLFTHHIKARTG